MSIKTPEAIAIDVHKRYALSGLTRSEQARFRAALVAAIESDRAQRQPNVTVRQITEAWEAMTDEDVSYFEDSWDAYLAGDDEPCITPTGLHEVTDGSCDQCGQKNFA